MPEWLHEFLVNGLAGAVDSNRVRVVREYPIRIGDRTLYGDLFVASPTRTALVELERTPDRVPRPGMHR